MKMEIKLDKQVIKALKQIEKELQFKDNNLVINFLLTTSLVATGYIKEKKVK